jgi:hypothetical protein
MKRANWCTSADMQRMVLMPVISSHPAGIAWLYAGWRRVERCPAGLSSSGIPGCLDCFCSLFTSTNPKSPMIGRVTLFP